MFNIFPPRLPKMKIGLRVEKSGLILYDAVEDGHSWTRNALNYFFGVMADSPGSGGSNDYGTGYLNFREANGYLGCSTTLVETRSGGFAGPISTSDYGIICGTSDEPFHLEDYCLWGKIVQGTGTGQLSHQAQPVPTVSWNGTTKVWKNTLSRVFNNNSGGSITVKEIGLYYSGTGAWAANLLLSRDVLETPVTVSNGGQLTVTVEISYDFTDYEALVAIKPALGALGSGGIYIGQVISYYNPYSHTKYGYILAPKSGGENSSKRWKNPVGTPSGYTANDCYGSIPSASLILDANSEIGAFCDAANDAVLGGYSDWYIPTVNEMGAIYAARNSLPGGENITNANYWTSQWNDTNNAYYVNPYTNGNGLLNQATQSYVRLIRRILLSDWDPA